MKVAGANRSKIPNSLSQYKTSIGNNCVSVTHRAVKFACNMGVSDMADRMV